jgi:hypothetical protein
MHITNNMGEADVMVTTKAFYRKRPRVVVDAERRGLPIYVLRANSVSQMEACLSEIFELEDLATASSLGAMEEAEEAIRQIRAGAPMVELAAQRASVRRQQHELARDAHLMSTSRGKEPNRRVCIYQAPPGEV